MSNENEVQVRAIRTFEGDEGFMTPDSKPFSVSRQRAADLKANGLVEEVGAKQAVEHENKQAATHQNKAAAKPANK